MVPCVYWKGSHYHIFDDGPIGNHSDVLAAVKSLEPIWYQIFFAQRLVLFINLTNLPLTDTVLFVLRRLLQFAVLHQNWHGWVNPFLLGATWTFASWNFLSTSPFFLSFTEYWLNISVWCCFCSHWFSYYTPCLRFTSGSWSCAPVMFIFPLQPKRPLSRDSCHFPKGSASNFLGACRRDIYLSMFLTECS